MSFSVGNLDNNTILKQILPLNFRDLRQSGEAWVLQLLNNGKGQLLSWTISLGHPVWCVAMLYLNWIFSPAEGPHPLVPYSSPNQLSCRTVLSLFWRSSGLCGQRRPPQIWSNLVWGNNYCSISFQIWYNLLFLYPVLTSSAIIHLINWNR